MICLFGGCAKNAEVVSDDVISTNQQKLVVYCGAGLKNIMEEISTKYTEKTGVEVEFIFNGSGALMSQAVLSKEGDIFIPGDKSFIEKLKEDEGEDIILDEKNLFENVPVILVSKDKQDEIQSMEDFTKTTSNIGLGEDSIAIGSLFNKVLEKKGLKESVDKQVSVRFGTVNQIVSAIEMGEIDAGVTFYINYVDCNQEKINMVKIPKEDNVTQQVTISVLKYSKNEVLAKEFLEFVSSEGQSVFDRYTYTD
jgi:molybdate transport system substrate-binding protein